jgi:DNA primase
VLKFHQLGLPAVSPFGWSLSEQQIAILAELAKGVICLPDRQKQKAFSS